MQSLEIFQLYRTEHAAASYPGFKVERLRNLSRHVAADEKAEGMVTFTEIVAEEAGAAIDEQIAYFERLGQAFEWKVYDFDSPPNLKTLLEQRGFAARDTEAFLALETREWNSRGREVPGIRIEKVTEVSQLRDFVAAETAVWEQDVSWHVEQYATALAADPQGLSIYCAYEGNTPVGTGRVSFPAGSFANLNGGGVVSRMRGRGIFSALLSVRIDEARARGYPWVAVDAAPMSRPILLRKGFQHVCWTYPMVRQ